MFETENSMWDDNYHVDYYIDRERAVFHVTSRTVNIMFQIQSVRDCEMFVNTGNHLRFCSVAKSDPYGVQEI